MTSISANGGRIGRCSSGSQSGPDFPGCLALVPESVEKLELTIGIHRKEESVVAIDHELTFGGQSFQGLAFENALVGIEVVEDTGTKNKVAGAGPTVGLGLLGESGDASVVGDGEHSKARGRLHGSDGCQSTVRAMEFEKLADVDISDAITIGDHERVAINVSLDSLDPAAGHRLLTGIRQCDLEILLVMSVEIVDAGLASQVNREVIIHGFIIQKILLNHLASIAQAEDEVSVAMVSVEFHDVPDDGLLADQDHGLGAKFCLFSEAAYLVLRKG